MTHRIVIVGGGAGGLELATRLGHSLGKKNKAHITLVDAHLTHIWKPLLHEVAAGTINCYEDEVNYFAHAAQHYFSFHLGRLENINREQKHIILAPLTDKTGVEIAKARRIAYDTLVIAVGSTSNDFGTLGAKDHCIFLDSRTQADKFHEQFLNLYLAAQARMLENPLAKKLNIAIIGAGATGVELAAELNHAAHEFNRYGLNSINPDDVNITLIEAAPRILPVLNAKVSEYAEKQLTDFGIRVMTNEKVTQIDANGIHCESGEFIEADLKVWSAGIKAPDFLQHLDGLETNRIHQLIVKPTLQTSRDDAIFALGDCASYTPKHAERPVPPRAQVANQQAIFLSKALKLHIEGKPLGEFHFTDKGSLISLSEKSTVGNLVGKINIQGLIARMMYVSLYRLHQVALHGAFKASLLFAKDVLSKNARPTLKLH